MDARQLVEEIYLESKEFRKIFEKFIEVYKTLYSEKVLSPSKIKDIVDFAKSSIALGLSTYIENTKKENITKDEAEKVLTEIVKSSLEIFAYLLDIVKGKANG